MKMTSMSAQGGVHVLYFRKAASTGMVLSVALD